MKINRKKYIYIAVFALCGSGFAQDQDRITTQPQPQQTTPATQTPTVGDRATTALSNLITDWRVEDLPPAVQKTVREHAAGQEIDDIDRENRSGRTVWEIEFEKDGDDTEIHVAEDGTLIPEGGRIAGTTPAQSRSPADATAAGTAAATQTGRSGVAQEWENLPKPVQQKAMQYGGKEKVADIDREDRQGKVSYELEFRREGRNLEIHFAEDGSILESSDPSAAPAKGSAPGSDTGRSPSATQPAQPQPQPDTTPEPPDASSRDQIRP